MKLRCRGKCPYIFFFLQATIMVVLVGFVFSPPRPYVPPTCDCHNGVVERENPHCKCVCFGDYLLPNCLYTAADTVEVELWLTTEAGKPSSDTYPLSSADIERGLDRLFGYTNRSGFFAFMRAISSFTSPRLRNSSVNSGMYYVAAVVSMPGWAAQHLLMYAAQKSGGEAEMVNSVSGANYTLYAAYDMHKGPPLPVMYYYESAGLFVEVDSNIFITAADCGWMFGALVLVVIVTRIEQLWLYSVASGMGAIYRRRQHNPKNPFAVGRDGASIGNASRPVSSPRTASKNDERGRPSSIGKPRRKEKADYSRRQSRASSRSSGSAKVDGRGKPRRNLKRMKDRSRSPVAKKNHSFTKRQYSSVV